MRIILRSALVGLVALVAVGAFLASRPAPTPQVPNLETIANKDVTLVIDYGSEANRSIDVFDLHQVPNSSTGWDVLRQARAQVQGTDNFPTGFVCRINWWPSVAEQSCKETPKANQGHWAYFVTNLELGKGWIVSGQGSATHIPDCGGFEGWSWVPAGKSITPPRYEVSVRGCK